jgi:hypothetical protein
MKYQNCCKFNSQFTILVFCWLVHCLRNQLRSGKIKVFFRNAASASRAKSSYFLSQKCQHSIYSQDLSPKKFPDVVYHRDSLAKRMGVSFAESGHDCCPTLLPESPSIHFKRIISWQAVSGEQAKLFRHIFKLKVERRRAFRFPD